MDTAGPSGLQKKTEQVHINNLPDDVLIMIFNFISPAELALVTMGVCRRWQNLIGSRVAKVSSFKDMKNLHEGVHVLMLLLPDSLQGSERFFPLAMDMIPRLRKLIVTKEFPLVGLDLTLVSKFVHLRHLDVFVTRQALDEHAIINKNITSFVANNTLNSKFLDNISQNKLTAFHMYGKLEHFMTKKMDVFFTIQSAYLRELTLRCPDMVDNQYKVLTLCINLVSLQLYTCSKLTSKGVEHFAALPPLKCLHITGTTLVRNQAMLQLIEGLPTSILELNLSASNFDSEQAEALAARLPTLRALELWRVPLRSDHLLRLATRLGELRRLDTDAELRRVQIRALERLPALVTLRCRWKKKIQSSLALLAAQAPVPQLVRGCGEGPSAAQFYHWERGLPAECVPADPCYAQGGDEFGPDDPYYPQGAQGLPYFIRYETLQAF